MRGGIELELAVTFSDLPRSAGASLLAEPLSLLVAELPDDRAAPAVTAYGSTMGAPTTL